MTNPPIDDPVDAAMSALFRNFLASPVWLARWLLPAFMLPLDAILVGLYVLWINKPLEAALGARYARRPHWSALFVTPTLVAFFLLIRDGYLSARSLLGP